MDIYCLQCSRNLTDLSNNSDEVSVKKQCVYHGK